MASSFVSTPSVSPSAIATNYIHRCSSSSSMLSFRLSTKPKLRFFTKGSPPSRMLCQRVKAQLNEGSFYQWSSFESLFSSICSFLDALLGSSFGFKDTNNDSSNAAAACKTISEVAEVITKDNKPSTEESISLFITQVASLVKLVDSRDIVELQLKQLDCEVTIKKNEAILQAQSHAQVAMIYSPLSPITLASTPTPIPAPSTPTLSTSSATVKSAKSSYPPLKCPMAGTFYRSPAPGEPPFVKVGDKVKKGQVLCIIEAMKLMNEIEADQSGTLVDILVEDGKSVSVDTPLFEIEP